MLFRTALPVYNLFGLAACPGDVLGRQKWGSLIEHRWLLGFDGEIAHSAGPGRLSSKRQQLHRGFPVELARASIPQNTL